MNANLSNVIGDMPITHIVATAYGRCIETAAAAAADGESLAIARGAARMIESGYDIKEAIEWIDRLAGTAASEATRRIILEYPAADAADTLKRAKSALSKRFSRIRIVVKAWAEASPRKPSESIDSLATSADKAGHARARSRKADAAAFARKTADAIRQNVAALVDAAKRGNQEQVATFVAAFESLADEAAALAASLAPPADKPATGKATAKRRRK